MTAKALAFVLGFIVAAWAVRVLGQSDEDQDERKVIPSSWTEALDHVALREAARQEARIRGDCAE